jgi:predicted kinase
LSRSGRSNFCPAPSGVSAPAATCARRACRSSDEISGEKNIYTPQFTQRTYQTLRTEAASQIAQSQGVIIDATCTEPAQRQLFLDLAEQAQVRLLFVECQADEDEIARRLEARTHSQEISETTSDATWDVHVQQQAQATPFSDLPDHVHLVVATDTALDHGLAKIEAFVQR